MRASSEAAPRRVQAPSVHAADESELAALEEGMRRVDTDIPFDHLVALEETTVNLLNKLQARRAQLCGGPGAAAAAASEPEGETSEAPPPQALPTLLRTMLSSGASRGFGDKAPADIT